MSYLSNAGIFCGKHLTGDSQSIDVCQRLAGFGYNNEDIEYVHNLVSGGWE